MNRAIITAGVLLGLTTTSGLTFAGDPGSSARIDPSLKAALASHRQVKVWVYLSDKGVSPAQLPGALAQLERTYDAHAIERRRLRRTAPGLFDERDLPLCPRYADAIAATGAKIHVESRWLNAASCYATAAQVQAIATLPFVARITPVRAGRCDDACWQPDPLPSNPYGSRDFYGYAGPQLTQIDVVALHARGCFAQGVRVGILDTGFRRDHDAFHSAEYPLQIIAEHDFINNDGNTDNQPGDDPGQNHHGTLILGTLASYEPDQLVGGAYGASFILCKTEDVTSETPVEEDNYVGGLEFIEANGGDMTTSSLGYIDWYTQSQLDGHTAVTTVAVNVAGENGVHCCTAAGNSGHDGDPATNTLIAPADALRVFTCGAANDDGSIAGFSSEGPTADGRVKPEVLARGVGTATISYDDTTSFVTASGTSLSTPLVAGAVACLTGAHPDWTPDQMREAVITTATEFATGPDPLFIRGYGLVNAARASIHCTADFNGDGDIGTDADIADFFACLGGSCCPTCGTADFNLDGDVGTDADIEAFFRVLGGGSC